jgi:hypothetical protein
VCSAVVTLHGDRYKDVVLPEVGGKMIAAINRPFIDFDGDGGHGMDLVYDGVKLSRGVIEVHGRPRLRSWTKVAVSAEPGDRTITTAEPVDFGVGDVLIITASERGAGMTQTEEITVESVVSPTTFTITAPLRFRHRVGWYTHPGFAPVDMRVEVGLLSRNVVLQGDDKSPAQLYGVHVMALHGAMLHLSGTEVRRCGQAFVLGRCVSVCLCVAVLACAQRERASGVFACVACASCCATLMPRSVIARPAGTAPTSTCR